MDPVKPKRRYDSPRRAEQARQTRAAVVACARRLFLRHGFAATTIAAIAAEAHVSAETIYKAFGGKPGLVRAICATALAGEGPVPAETRSDELQAHQPDPRQIIRGWGQLTIEVAPRIAPILLLIRSAAATDHEMAGLRAEIDTSRLSRMTSNARNLADGRPPARRHHRPGRRRSDVDLQLTRTLRTARPQPGLARRTLCHLHRRRDDRRPAPAPAARASPEPGPLIPLASRAHRHNRAHESPDPARAQRSGQRPPEAPATTGGHRLTECSIRPRPGPRHPRTAGEITGGQARGKQQATAFARGPAIPGSLQRAPRPACIHMGLLPVPWVVSAAGEGGALTTEAEHGQGDEGLGGVESVCHAGDEPYLGID